MMMMMMMMMMMINTQKRYHIWGTLVLASTEVCIALVVLVVCCICCACCAGNGLASLFFAVEAHELYLQDIIS
jgi:hypothetical protein